MELKAVVEIKIDMEDGETYAHALLRLCDSLLKVNHNFYIKDTKMIETNK